MLDKQSVMILKLIKEYGDFLEIKHLKVLIKFNSVTILKHAVRFWKEELIDVRIPKEVDFIYYKDNEYFPMNAEFRISLQGISFLEEKQKKDRELRFTRIIAIIGAITGIISLILHKF